MNYYHKEITKMKRMIIRVFKPFIERFPLIAMFYRVLRDNIQYSSEPIETTMGFKFIGSSTIQLGKFEPEETEVFKSIINNVDILVNVGANIGYYCCLALVRNKYVIAFEPINLNVKHLLRNIKANNWEDRIEVYPIALSNKKSGAIEIYGGGTGASLIRGWAGTPVNYVNLVPISTLDNVIGNRLKNKRSFIVVDIEGAEKYMLEGATSVLEMTPKPIWMMEITVSEHQPKGVKINPNLLSTFQLFWERGYIARTANIENRVVLSDELNQIIKTGVDTLHTHNFLFIEKENDKLKL